MSGHRTGQLVARIWGTGLDSSRRSEYDEFARSRSMTMFQRHQGFRGVLFASFGEEQVVITLWRDREAVAALEHSGDYRETVRAIGATGLPPASADNRGARCTRQSGRDRVAPAGR